MSWKLIIAGNSREVRIYSSKTVIPGVPTWTLHACCHSTSFLSFLCLLCSFWSVSRLLHSLSSFFQISLSPLSLSLSLSPALLSATSFQSDEYALVIRWHKDNLCSLSYVCVCVCVCVGVGIHICMKYEFIIKCPPQTNMRVNICVCLEQLIMCMGSE